MSRAGAPHLYDSIRADRVHKLLMFGFTERQARFLLHVLVHSGVFLERQYCQSAGIAHGQKTHDFLRGQDLETTQRYMHLSPAALDAAIRLLDEAGPALGPAKAGPHDSRGEIVEAAGKSAQIR
jgi:hypothetical protein